MSIDDVSKAIKLRIALSISSLDKLKSNPRDVHEAKRYSRPLLSSCQLFTATNFVYRNFIRNLVVPQRHQKLFIEVVLTSFEEILLHTHKQQDSLALHKETQICWGKFFRLCQNWFAFSCKSCFRWTLGKSNLKFHLLTVAVYVYRLHYCGVQEVLWLFIHSIGQIYWTGSLHSKNEIKLSRVVFT